MNYKKGLIIISVFICVFFIISSVSATTDNETDMNETLDVDVSQAAVQEDTTDSEPLATQDNQDTLGATSTIYFDASAAYDGDGSSARPYKYYSTDKIPFGSTAIFKNGVYTVESTLSVSSSLSYKTTFIGQGSNTIFKSSSSILGFKVRDNSNFVLQNLTIDGVRINNNGNIQATDVTFKNCNNKYSQIYSISTSVTPTLKLKNCNFQNNFASDLGGSVSFYKGTIEIENCNFYNSLSNIFGGAVQLRNGNLKIVNSRFYSAESKHGGAIYALNSNVNIIGTLFDSCKSEVFGGSIAGENIKLTVNNCNFTNSQSSTDGGGAIYVVDSNSDVSNSFFINDAAYFGGAICNLNSNLNVSSCQFTNDYAEYYGGSIYNMYGNVNLTNSYFYNSRAKSSGGAIMERFSSSFNINQNTFIKTYAQYGPVIFVDGDEEPVSIQANNNTYRDVYRLVAVYKGSFDGNEVEAASNYLTFSVSSDLNYLPAESDSTILNNQYVDLKIILPDGSNLKQTHLVSENVILFNITKKDSNLINKDIEIYLIDEAGDIVYMASIDLANGNYINENLYNITFFNYLLNLEYDTIYSNRPISAVPLLNFTESESPSSFPDSYDSRDYGYITPVKNQASGGNCWAFGGISTLEACLKKATGIEFDFSEENVKNLMAEYSQFGWDANGGGNDQMIWAYLASWFGPVYDEYDVYDEYSALSVLYNPALHIQNIRTLPDVRDQSQTSYIKEIKKAIMQYGAVTMTTSWSSVENHCMSIVGWDDKYNGYDYFGSFAQKVWIVKNSYGPNWEHNGYLYISFNKQIFDVYTFVFSSQDKEYSDIYQYDYGGLSTYLTGYYKYYKNKFISKGNDNLSAVSTYFDKDTDYTIKVYVNGALVKTQDGSAKEGYNVIPLNEEISLSKGDEFVIEFKSNSGIPVCKATYSNKETFNEGLSFISVNGEQSWTDLYRFSSISPYVACIKAFTRPARLEEVEVNFKYNITGNLPTGEVFPFVVELPQDVEGLVTFTINGINYYAQAKDGRATLNIAFDTPGNYSMNIHYKSSLEESNDISFNFTVASNVQSLISVSAEEVVKYYGGSKKFEAVLTDYGFPLSGKTVTVGVDGKSYSAVTNSDGEIALDLDLNPGIYTVFIYYNSKVFTSKITVKSTIGAVDSSGEFLNTIVNATFLDSEGYLVQDGKAVFKVNGNEKIGTISNGFASAKIDLDAGTYTLVIINPITGEQVEKNLFIDKTNPGLFTVSIYQEGYIVSIYADIPLDATGYVTLACGGKDTYAPVDSNRVYINNKGCTKLEIRNLEVGNHPITAYYEGDDNYRSASFEDDFTVADTDIVITADDSAFYYKSSNNRYSVNVMNMGQPVNEGVVHFTIDGFTQSPAISDGHASITVQNKPGVYTVVVDYGGVNQTHTITIYPTILSNDTFTGEYLNSTVSATFLDSNGNPLKNRSVIFYAGDDEYHAVTDDEGYMSCDVSLVVGVYEVLFINPSNQEEFKATLNVTRITPKLNYTLKEYSDSYSFAGVLSQAATGGSFIYTLGGKDYVVKYNRGFSDYVIHTTRAGVYNITVRFTGDNNLNPVSESFILTLKNKADTISASGVTVSYGQSGRVSLTLLYSDGKAKANSRITVVGNGKTSYLTTNSYGKATYTFNWNAGTYTVKFTSNNNGAKTVNVVVKKSTPAITAAKKTYKVKTKTKKYTATFKLSNRNLKNYKLTLKVKGKTYSAITNAKGQATFKITKLKKKGTFKAVITFAGDKNLNKVTKSVKIKVK